MNLFDNILNQSKNKFLGTQPSVPSTPSFATPQAPRTVNYTAPQVQQKPSMTLFSDEQQMFQKMKADNLDDNTAYSMLKKRRMDILGGNDLGNDEKEMLLKMQADNVPVKQAVSMIQQRRKDQFNKKYEEGNLLQKGAYNTLAFAAGNLETLAKYSGNTLDFITGGTMGFGDEVNKMEQVTSSPEFSESSAFTAGTYLPDVALAVSPVGGQYLAGAKGMTGLQGANLFSKIGAKNLTQGLMGRSAVVGAGFGATQPILDKGSDATMEDIATGAAVGGALGAVATPVIGKVLKYGQAGYRGGLTGMGKSITRDIKSGVNAITPSGANISTKANRFNANEIREFTKTTGQSPGDFATSRGMTKVGDDAVVEATNLWQKSKDQADEALKAIKGRFRFTDEGEDLLKTTIDDLETRLVNTKSPDSKRISQLKAKYEDSGLTMSEINEVKRAYSNNYKYSFVDAGSESAIRSRNLQDAVRKWQFKVAEENGLTNLKEINKTTQGWKMFADSLSKKIQGSSGNNNVSLTDWIALSGGSPENIALYLGKKLASSDKVKSGAIKLFSKKTKPSIIQASKADIQRANFQKDVNRGVSGVGDRSGGKSLVKPVGLLTAPTGKATGAKNFRVNQPAEKTPIKNEGQVGSRPGTNAKIKTPESVKLSKEAERQAEIKLIENDLNSALNSKYNPNKIQATKEFIDRNITQGKLTKEEAITLVENQYEKATGFDKPHYEKMLNDLYSNKKIESFDDLLNEKPVQNIVKTPRQEFLETPEGIYEEINKKANDRRFNPEKANALIAKFKEKTGIDLMKNPMQKFDEKGNVIRTIVKPNTIKNESKVEIGKEIKNDNITIEGKKFNGNPVLIDGKEVGGVSYRVYGNDAKTIELSKIEIYPEFRGNNYAKKVIEKIFKDNPNSKEISLNSAKTAEPIWENIGFKFKDHITKEGKVYGISRSDFLSNNKSNAKQPRIITKPSNTIPEGYFKNAFGEIQKNPSNKKGGFIRNPFAKPEPKRLFAGENSAQPPKSKTGWLKGADGKMRFEIDDSGAKVNANVDLTKNAKAVYLKYILEHKELYKNYPELSDTSVLFDKSVKEGLAHFDPKTGAIHLSYDEFINPNTGKIWGAGSSGTHDNIKSKLLHEIQHAIQETEGFARGGSVGRELQDWAYNEQSYVRKITKLLQEDLSKIESNPRLKKAFSLLDNEMTKENPNFSKIENEYKDVLKPYQNLSKDIARQKDMEKALDSNDYELYKNLAGEVEARNVQSRMNLTAKERTIKKPEYTEDVPRAKQIIRMDSKGPSMLIKKPKQSATMGDMETKKLIEEKRNTEYKKRVDNLIDLAKKHYENASGYNKFMRMNDWKKQFLSDLESNSGIEWSKSTDEGIKKIGIDPDKTVYIHSFYPKYVKGTGIAKDDFLSKMKEAMSYKLRPVKYFATSSFSEDGANFFDKLVKEGYLKRVTDTVSQYDEFPSFGIPDPVKKYKTGISSGMNVFELTDKILSYERKIDKEKLFEEAVRGKVIGKPSIYKMFGIK